MSDYVRDAHGWEYFVCGREDWEGWTRTCRLGGAKCVALFDQHGVSDKLTAQESLYVGVELDHLNSPGVCMPSLLCSFGHEHREAGFKDPRRQAFMAELDGYIFTDFRKLWGNTITARLLRDLHPKAIGLAGDKSSVSTLLGVPSLLFDDHEDVIDVHRRGHEFNEGIVVRLDGRRCGWRERPGYRYSYDPKEWPGLVRDFGRRHGVFNDELLRNGEDAGYFERFCFNRAIGSC